MMRDINKLNDNPCLLAACQFTKVKSYGERAQYFMVRIHYSKQLQTILLLETYFFL